MEDMVEEFWRNTGDQHCRAFPLYVLVSDWRAEFQPVFFLFHVGINKSDKPNRMSDLFNFSPCLNVCFSFPEVFLVRNRKPWNIFWIFCKEINCQETIVFTYIQTSMCPEKEEPETKRDWSGQDQTQLCRWWALWLWASFSTALCHSFLFCQTRTKIVLMERKEFELKELTHINCLAQFLTRKGHKAFHGTFYSPYSA